MRNSGHKPLASLVKGRWIFAKQKDGGIPLKFRSRFKEISSQNSPSGTSGAIPLAVESFRQGDQGRTPAVEIPRYARNDRWKMHNYPLDKRRSRLYNIKV